MKAMNDNNVTHCNNDNYRLITIQGAGGMLKHIVLSYSLSRLLNKQKKKKNLIKTGVYNIYRLRPTPDNMHTLENTSLVIKQNYYKEEELVPSHLPLYLPKHIPTNRNHVIQN